VTLGAEVQAFKLLQEASSSVALHVAFPGV